MGYYRLEKYLKDTDTWNPIETFDTYFELYEHVDNLYPYVAVAQGDNKYKFLFQGFDLPNEFFVASLRAKWVE